ncbi:class D beta-lactamase [Marinifilum fragile]|uniref:class D beta-lactamase n=1 Tax=Marinifilum fragile TaxID=570161 RepID=UPI002AA73692|nr:class D beta-lactamase [Marinifilum fragile]
MKKVLFLFISMILFSCTKQQESILDAYKANDLQKIFEQANVNGCFIIHDFKNNKSLTYNSERLDSAFLPASTFKIINSMIALETEVIKDENEIIKWDGKKRFIESWNQDHNLASGIKNSVVWLYQELARQIGEERMKYWVEKADYGNKNIGGKIDLFWLNGDIRISPNQQIDFLKRLYLNQLPFQKKNQETVKKILLVEQADDYSIRAKTGWAARIEQEIGWYVGYLENKDNVYFFALNMDINSSDEAKYRKQITTDILKVLNLKK